jgi:hypothetical protein
MPNYPRNITPNYDIDYNHKVYDLVYNLKNDEEFDITTNVSPRNKEKFIKIIIGFIESENEVLRPFKIILNEEKTKFRKISSRELLAPEKNK